MSVVYFKSKEKVIEKKEEFIFRCKCSNATFFLYESSKVECASCGSIVTNSIDTGWRKALPSVNGDEPQLERNFRSSICSTEDFAKKHALSIAKQEATNCVISLKEDGTISVWNRSMDKELVSKLIDDAKEMITTRIEACENSND